MDMSTPKEIEPAKILETAMDLIGLATSSVRITMQASEELANPLPPNYFALLEDTLTRGVRVIRIGFGTEGGFEPLHGRVHIPHPSYTFHRTDATDYRRMILADDSKLMFIKNDTHGRHIFYTEDSDLIRDYKEYFEMHLTDS